MNRATPGIVTRWRFGLSLAFVIVTGSAVLLRAHEVPASTVIHGFVKVENRDIQLLLRVPLGLLEAARIPTNANVIDIERADAALTRALAGLAESIQIWSDDEPLDAYEQSGRLSLPSDRSFEKFDSAYRHARSRPEPDLQIYRGQGFLDAQFAYRLQSADTALSLQTLFAIEVGTPVQLAIHYLPANEPARALIVASPSDRVSLNPTWYQAMGGFIWVGVTHILAGWDHLLFLVCLLLPLRSVATIAGAVTAFTLGHSITLLGTAAGIAPAGDWFPPFVESAIAASIVYMAIENIVTIQPKHRWLTAALFGLLHGFGFSYSVQESLQFAGDHLLVSLLAFNVGVEVGQAFVVGAVLLLRPLILRGALQGRMGDIIVAALVANVAWDWMIARGAILWQTPWPRIQAVELITLTLYVGVAMLALGVWRILGTWLPSAFLFRDPRTMTGLNQAGSIQ